MGTREALYLQSFSLEQMQQSLRNINTQSAIMDLANQNIRFKEIAARPSVLVMIATIWKDLVIDRINSAKVIQMYIKHVEERQVEKEIKIAEQEGHEFTQLSCAERSYFMEAIAAYMLAKNLPNQIYKDDLNTVIQTMIDKIPDVVSESLSSVEGNQKREPLRQRLLSSGSKKDRELAIESIQTDVRACGLIVTDLTKTDTFKFAHKSFMEFLSAKVFADWMTRKETEDNITESIVNTYKLKKKYIFKQEEIRDFFAERLANNI